MTKVRTERSIADGIEPCLGTPARRPLLFGATGWRSGCEIIDGREALRIVVASEMSLAGVLRGIGLRPAGRNYENVSRVIRSYGFSTQHWTARGICEVGTTRVSPKFRSRGSWFATLHTTATNCAVD